LKNSDGAVLREKIRVRAFESDEKSLSLTQGPTGEGCQRQLYGKKLIYLGGSNHQRKSTDSVGGRRN